MKNKRYIYPWLLLPLIACLLAGMAGCSDDVTDEGGTSSDSGTRLVITTRGISGNETDYENCVQTLRIIVFDESNKLMLNKRETITAADIKGSTDDTYIEITELVEGLSGKCHFYVVANEGSVGGLENAFTAPVRDDLLKKTISFVATDATLSKPILMTGKVEDYTIWPGKTNSLTIVMDRALARAEIESVTNKETTIPVTDYTLSWSLLVPDSYYLFQPITVEETNSITITSTTNGPLYFPETTDFQITNLSLTVEGTTYSNIVIGESITKVSRNGHIGVNVKLQNNQCLQVNWDIDPWESHELPPAYE